MEAALEYLIKATPRERLEYLQPGQDGPPGVRIHVTPRGARGYYPSDIPDIREEEPGAHDRFSDAPDIAVDRTELEPEEEREVEVVQAPEAKPESSSDAKPRKKASLKTFMVNVDTNVGSQRIANRRRLREGKQEIRVIDKVEMLSPVLSDVFNKDFRISDFQDMYSTALENFSTDIIDISTFVFGDITDQGIKIAVDIRGNARGQMERAGFMLREFKRPKSGVNEGKLEVKHEAFTLFPMFQEKGVAADINEHVEKEYEQLGVHSIHLTANVDIGGYAWARQGYDFENLTERKKIRKRFIDQISQLSKGRRRYVPPDEYDATLGHKLSDLQESGDLQAVFEELYPDQDWSELKDLGDERLEELWELEDEGEEKVLKWSELLEKIETVRPSGKAPRISGDDSVRAVTQIEKFKHAWEFAEWHFNGEHLGKEFMLGSWWEARKILDKKSKGYQVGKEYFAAKRNKKNTS